MLLERPLYKIEIDGRGINDQEIHKYVKEKGHAKKIEEIIKAYPTYPEKHDVSWGFEVYHNAKRCQFKGTIMDLAVLYNNTEVIEVIARHYRTDAEDKAHFGYALLNMVQNNNFELVELLLEKGAPTNISYPDGSTCLHIAVSRDLRFMKKLLLSGADVNAIDNMRRTPLHIAVLHDPHIVKLLLSGANLNATDFKGETPYDVAFENKRWSSLLMLAEAANGPDYRYGKELSAVIRAGWFHESWPLFSKKKIDLRYQDENGNTFLHSAVGSRNAEVITKLLLLDEELENVKNNQQQTPKDYAEFLDEFSLRSLSVFFLGSCHIYQNAWAAGWEKFTTKEHAVEREIRATTRIVEAEFKEHDAMLQSYRDSLKTVKACWTDKSALAKLEQVKKDFIGKCIEHARSRVLFLADISHKGEGHSAFVSEYFILFDHLGGRAEKEFKKFSALESSIAEVERQIGLASAHKPHALPPMELAPSEQADKVTIFDGLMGRRNANPPPVDPRVTAAEKTVASRKFF